ncbi:MAG: bacillithiol biosynthesis deacetylase BshB1, partial [Nitrospinota bacterium]
SQLSDAARFTAKLSKTDIPGEPHYPKKVLYFFCLHLTLNFKPSFILDVSPFMYKKTEAVKAYESQFKAQGKEEYIQKKCIDNGRYWGSLIKRECGEPFLCREEIGLGKIGEILF